MKIFVILSRVPFPLEKGDKLRAFHQLRELKKNNEIILCCITDIQPAAEAAHALKEICHEFHIFHLKKWKIYANLIFNILSRKPFQVMYFYQKNIHSAIQKLIATTQPDHIYCQLIRTAEYAKNEHDFPKTLDYQDAFSKGMERRLKKARWPMTEIFAAERRRLINYENIIFEYFEGKTIISEEDRRYIYHPERKNIAIVTNGIDTRFFKNDHSTQPTYDLVFTGNMSYPPNIETAEYIVKIVMPLIRKSKPDTTLLLAGSDPHRRVKALDKYRGVHVSGWVDDIREAYASARIFFAPMQIGTGLQNKLLEAMAMELPCVTSPLANKALKAKDKKDIFEANVPEDYATLICALLDDPDLRNAIGKRGRTFVQSRFSWEASSAQLESAMAAQNKAVVV